MVKKLIIWKNVILYIRGCREYICIIGTTMLLYELTSGSAKLHQHDKFQYKPLLFYTFAKFCFTDFKNIQIISNIFFEALNYEENLDQTMCRILNYIFHWLSLEILKNIFSKTLTPCISEFKSRKDIDSKNSSICLTRLHIAISLSGTSCI